MLDHLTAACADFGGAAPGVDVVALTSISGFLGVDPGKEGWIAYVDASGTKILEHYPMPLLTDGSIDFAQLASILGRFRGRVRLAIVETPITIPDQDPSTALVSGIGFGAIVAILVMHDIPRECIEPRKWKGEMGILVPNAKKGGAVSPPELAKGLRRNDLRKRAGLLKRRVKDESYAPTEAELALLAFADATSDRSSLRKKQAKELSERKAKELFPGYDFRASPRCKIAHDGKCESALLGVVASRRFGGSR